MRAERVARNGAGLIAAGCLVVRRRSSAAPARPIAGGAVAPRPLVTRADPSMPTPSSTRPLPAAGKAVVGHGRRRLRRDAAVRRPDGASLRGARRAARAHGRGGDASPFPSAAARGGFARATAPSRSTPSARRACLDGLRDVVLQTPEQRARCGADGMVPVWERGGEHRRRRATASTSSSSPTEPCELPFVFVTPAQALRVCHAQGKRLCTQDEWNLACRGDPDGGPDRVYAYGDELDLTVCNTNKSRAHGPVLRRLDQREALDDVRDQHRAVGRLPALPLALRRLRPARQRGRDHDALRAGRRQDVLAAEGQRLLLRRRREEADGPRRLLDQVPRPVQLRPALARREDRGGART